MCHPYLICSVSQKWDLIWWDFLEEKDFADLKVQVSYWVKENISKLQECTHLLVEKLSEDQIELISSSVLAVDGVRTEIHVPKHANHVPSLRIQWDESKVKITPDEARRQLREGHPSIQTVGNKSTIGITTWMMVPGQERIVAKRVHEILKSAT